MKVTSPKQKPQEFFSAVVLTATKIEQNLGIAVAVAVGAAAIHGVFEQRGGVGRKQDCNVTESKL